MGNKMIYGASTSSLNMEPEDVFSTLSSRLRIQILKILGNGAMSVNEIQSELTRRGFRVRYRESVYKAVEKLVSIGLVTKYYDSTKKSIAYGLQKTRIEVDLKTGKITFI